MSWKFKPALFFALFASLVIVLSGCTSIPKQDFNAKANADLKKIGVVVDANTEKYSVFLLHHPGVSFGLIGGLVAAADMSSKGSTFTSEVKLSKEMLLEEFRQALRGLEKDGRYEIQFLAADTDPEKLLSSYDDLTKQVDAYLDIRLISIGYAAQHVNTPYVPDLTAKVKMVHARTQQTLYEATMVYGEAWRRSEGLVQLPNDKQYSFVDFDHLIREIDKARAGLLAGSNSVGQRVNLDLR